MAGARQVEVFPVLPLMGTLTLGVGALSYAGQFAISVIADRDTVPDLRAFTAGMRADLDRLSSPLGLCGRKCTDSADKRD